MITQAKLRRQRIFALSKTHFSPELLLICIYDYIRFFLFGDGFLVLVGLFYFFGSCGRKRNDVYARISCNLIKGSFLSMAASVLVFREVEKRESHNGLLCSPLI